MTQKLGEGDERISLMSRRKLSQNSDVRRDVKVLRRGGYLVHAH